MSAILPVAKTQFFDNNGAPLVGGLVYYYIPNTSTPKNTYQDEGLTILNTNPVVLDARGEATIWGSGAYRMVLKDSLGNLIWDGLTDDPTSGVDAIITNVQNGEYTWLTSVLGTNTITASATPTLTAYVTGQVFRLQSANANTDAVTLNIDGLGGVAITKNGANPLVSGDIPASSIIEVTYDGTQFQLTSAIYAIARGGDQLTGLLKYKSGASIASAATVDLTSATGNIVHITGTTGISAWTLTNGQVMDVIFDGILTLTYNATTNNLPGQANIISAVGDRARIYYDGTTVWVLNYTPARIVGGTVTQLTSKTTDVTLNQIRGRITMNNSSLSAGATAGFTLNNSFVIQTTDTVIVNVAGGVSGYNNYLCFAAISGDGTVRIYITNNTGGSLSEAVVLNFALIKGATS